jgi:hypothetical protein
MEICSNDRNISPTGTVVVVLELEEEVVVEEVVVDAVPPV